MRPKRWIYAGAAIGGIGLAALSGLAQGRSQPPPPPLPSAPDRGRTPDRWLSEVRSAGDPSSAVEAYARAREALAHDTAAEHAYMERMVAFGLPEMTEAQARDVKARWPRDGVSRAVVAYMDARRGNDIAALTGVVQAADLTPDDRFVQRTSGQLVAWFDVRADKRQIPTDLAASVESLRRRMRGNFEFNEAYRRARNTYREDWRERGFHAGAPFTRELWSDPYANVGVTEPWKPDAWHRQSQFGPGVRPEGPLPPDDGRDRDRDRDGRR